MEIKREIDTSLAKYSLINLNDEQFAFIESSLRYYCQFITHRDSMDEETPLGDLMSKIKKMRESSVTIIN